MAGNRKITTPPDIDQFEQELAEFWWQRIRQNMPIQVVDSRNEDDPNAAQRENRTRVKAETALFGFNPTDKNAVLEQYRQGKARRVTFPLPPVIFPQNAKTPTAVPYLRVTVSANTADDHELEHLLTEKTRKFPKTSHE